MDSTELIRVAPSVEIRLVDADTTTRSRMWSKLRDVHELFRGQPDGLQVVELETPPPSENALRGVYYDVSAGAALWANQQRMLAYYVPAGVRPLQIIVLCDLRRDPDQTDPEHGISPADVGRAARIRDTAVEDGHSELNLP